MIKSKTPIKTTISLALAAMLMVGSSHQASAKEPSSSDSKVVLRSEVKFDKLNPARGDQSPKAGTLWGDRKGNGPTGFLFSPVDGFQSPPHIHNVTYRGIVISGLVHNDDPNADEMWLPRGSFWTQPKGKVHITSAKGHNTLAYIEIEEGPYLVHPPQEEFETPEVPINVDASNLVWTDLANSEDGVQIAYLWGQPKAGQLNGTLLKLPAGFSGKVRGYDSTFHGVVIQGSPELHVSDKVETKTLEPGSYFSSNEQSMYPLTNDTNDCIIYIRTKGKFDVISI